jgi:Fibronectin type III domain
MMGRTRLVAAAVAAALAGLAGGAGGLAALAGPAGAASSGQPSGTSPPNNQPSQSGPPFVSISKPASNAVVSTTTQSVEGKITLADPSQGQITSVQIRMTSSDGGTTTTFPATPQSTSSGQQGQSNWAFSGSVQSSSLAWNGPYQVTATATESDPNTQPRQGTSPTVDFAEAVPPQAPTGVSAAKNSDGSAVTVSWQANPERDIVGYEVQRASVNGSNWSTVSPSPGGTDTNFRDSSVHSGSDYQYRVIAVRSGAQQGQTINSAPSTSASTVTPPISSLFGPGGSIPELPAAIQAITDPVAGQVHPGAGPGGPVTGSPTAGGYGNLPYSGGQAALSEPGTPGAQDPKGHSGGGNLVRTALFVAAALILLAIAAHLIRMRRALDDSLEPIGVESWDRHAAGMDETAEVTTVGTDRRGSDVTRAVTAQRGGSDVTRAMTAQRRR